MLSVAQQQDWRCVLKVGVLPHASAEGLESLAAALRRGDPRLLRRKITEPLDLYASMPCVASCPLAWLGWRGEAGRPVGGVFDDWEALLDRCAEATGSKLAAQSFISAWDGWGGTDYDAEPLPAGELLAELEQELTRRAAREMIA